MIQIKSTIPNNYRCSISEIDRRENLRHHKFDKMNRASLKDCTKMCIFNYHAQFLYIWLGIEYDMQ